MICDIIPTMTNKIETGPEDTEQSNTDTLRLLLSGLDNYDCTIIDAATQRLAKKYGDSAAIGALCATMRLLHNNNRFTFPDKDTR